MLVRVVAVVLALTGCRQVLGLDDPKLGGDASTAMDTQVADIAADVPAGYTSLSFQQGVAGYTQGHDTYIDSGSPNATRGQDSRLRYRQNARWALLRFDGLFDAMQIPVGAAIQSAHLSLMVDQAGSTATLVEVAVPWDESTSYNTFGPTAGVDVDDLGQQVTTIANTQGTQTLDVTQSLSSWAAAPSTNQGWIMIAAQGTDTQISSNEDGAPAQRPHLVVVFKQ